MMNPEWKTVELGDEAIQHMIAYLQRAGAASFFRHVLRELDLTHGRVVTRLPVELHVDAERLLRFDWSILPAPDLNDYPVQMSKDGRRLGYVVPKSTLDHLLVEVIQEHLGDGEDRICIFQATAEKPERARSLAPALRVLDHGDDAYYLLAGNDVHSPDRILETIQEASFHQWLVAGALTSASEEVPLSPDKNTLTSDEIRILASRTETIIIGAYDGEGFLVWSQM